ncbi:dienelactone hydrolase family protein [Marimonas arenosa]|uniref:Dienelactone hydrolase family protein n=1 Tax=Marimonas arenosa TaxID=1795305 RepID=A0AAE4B2H8_9RHOB|nr:dienelactone hydrolase family protein [Marimonas arenosa]MDQ2088297.1 dienelactone hydrolase family protein [Marimonas arenosa]
MPEMIYDAGDTSCHGYLALPQGNGPFPGVLVVPAFMGLSDMERGHADRLAAMGYVALGVDYYGNGALAGTRDEAAAMMGLLNTDRPLLATRMQAALDALKGLAQVDAGRCGAIGFCFGGKAVLDLARSGADFRAGVSFHGVYDAPPAGSRDMTAAILILDGWDDPLDPPEVKVALAEELTAHCKDWQFLAFGHTGHAFTNPNANAPGMGFSETANARSWDAMARFFEETLS